MSRYYEEGYIDTNYFDEVVADTGTYYAEGYIEAGYFEGDAVGGAQELNANLNAVSTIQATATVLKIAAVAVVQNSSLYANPVVVKNTQADFGLNATVNAQNIRIRTGAVQQFALFAPSITATISKNHSIDTLSNFSMLATASPIRGDTITLDTLVNLSLQADRLRTFESVQSASSSIVSQAVRTREINLLLTASSSITVEITKLKQTSATLNAQTQQTVDNTRIIDVSAAIVAQTQQTATATRTQQFDATLDAFYTNLAVVAKIGNTLVAMDSVFALGTATEPDGSVSIGGNSIGGTVVRDTFATLSSDTALASTALVTRTTSATATAQFLLGTATDGSVGIGNDSIDFTVLNETSATLSANITISATGKLVTSATAGLDFTATFACDATRIPFGLPIESAFTLTAQPDFRPFTVRTEGTVALDTDIKKFGDASIRVGNTPGFDRFYIQGANDALNTRFYARNFEQEPSETTTGVNDGYYTSFDIAFWLYVPYKLSSQVLGVFNPVNGPFSNTGSGAQFEIRIEPFGLGYNYKAILLNGGANYIPGDTVIVYGSQLGGVDGVNDCEISIDNVTSGAQAISAFSVSGDPVQEDLIAYDLVTITNEYGDSHSLQISKEFLRTTTLPMVNEGYWDDTVGELAGDTWHHIRWNRKLELGVGVGSTQAFFFYDTIYVNGVQHQTDGVGSYNADPQYNSSYPGTISDISFGHGSGYSFDEVHVYSGYAPDIPDYPTEEYANTENTALLLHGITDLGDDSIIVKQSGATLNSTTQLSAVNQSVSDATVDMTSAGGFELSANASRVGAVDLIATTTQTVSAVRLVYADAALDAQFTQAPAGGLLKASTSSLQASTAISAVNVRLGKLDAQLEFTATITANLRELSGGNATLTPTAELTATARVDSVGSSNLTSAFTIQVEADQIQELVVDAMVATATSAIDVTRNPGIIAQLDSAFVSDIYANQQGLLSATLNSRFIQDVIFYDTKRYVYVIPNESRTFKIESETRSHRIHNENRTFTLGEQ